MTTLTLHKLPEGFIVASDEKPEIGELYIDDTNLIRRSVMGSGTYWGNRNSYRKVIAQQDQIDFSALTEKEQKEIEWFDAKPEMIPFPNSEGLRDGKEIKTWMNGWKEGHVEGFQKAQELLSDRRFTLDDMIDCFNSAREYRMKNVFAYDEARDYIQSLQPKSWTIEGQWENNKLKVTKIL